MRFLNKVVSVLVSVVSIPADQRGDTDFVELYWENLERGYSGIYRPKVR